MPLPDYNILKRRLDDDGPLAPSTFGRYNKEQLKQLCEDYRLNVCSTAKRGGSPTKDDYTAALLTYVRSILDCGITR